MDNPSDCLRQHRFKDLFINVLGWDPAWGLTAASREGCDLTFRTIAEKRGVQVVCCRAGRRVLAQPHLLRQFEDALARSVHEHIVIFDGGEPPKQVWTWAVRTPDGQWVRHREGPFFSASAPGALLDRLAGLQVGGDEADRGTRVDALDRIRRALGCPAAPILPVKRSSFAERSDELLWAYRRGDEAAFHQFILLHRPLARQISRRLEHLFGTAAEDAEQMAVIGLMEAARRFDPERGFQFSTYADCVVKSACYRLGLESARLVRIPAYAFWNCFRRRRVLDRLYVAAGPSSVSRYLADLEDQTPGAAALWRAYVQSDSTASLSDRRQPEYIRARQIAHDSPSPLDQLVHSDEAATLQDALSRLPSRERTIIRLRYGLDGKTHTLKHVAALFNVTKERIRQLQLQAEQTIRERLVGEEPSPRSHSSPLKALVDVAA